MSWLSVEPVPLGDVKLEPESLVGYGTRGEVLVSDTDGADELASASALLELSTSETGALCVCHVV